MGSTGAFERSFKMMKIEKRCELATSVKDVPLVFMSPYEHHSNILPWVVNYSEKNEFF
jgi:selenocysteine lyase/cysteine desulfurase